MEKKRVASLALALMLLAVRVRPATADRDMEFLLATAHLPVLRRDERDWMIR